MNKENLVFDKENSVFVDKYNGIKYIQIGENLTPLVAGGLPAELQEHNGISYMVNHLGTFEVADDGRVSFNSLRSNLDGSPLFFTDDGKLESKYSNCRYELVNGAPVALYDTEHGIKAHVEQRDGRYCLVSEQGTYDIDENGVVLTPKEILFKTVKEMESEFFADPDRTEMYLEATPEERKRMLDEFYREHGISEEMQNYAFDGHKELSPQDQTMINNIKGVVEKTRLGNVTEMTAQLGKGISAEIDERVDEQTKGIEI